ncbi:hypothetical protein HELRODRAFT_189512 [Helobdella robusta]|uniref:Uncharacterized protein n=1 Tax=Helobdella robusta TaxID=6412 RepID=T1FR42_HELRO|nr:hypothetical protein HELRODRAFT_189512 [Helobdella robusta]ESN92577.1 hypothetical protein HELRODRAFT_189512 [Helobdella robusta]
MTLILKISGNGNTSSYGNSSGYYGDDDVKMKMSSKQGWADCADEVPTSYNMFKNMPLYGIIVISILILLTATTFGLYIEEIFFIYNNFKIRTRATKTVWILGFFPIFSFTGLIGTVVPRSGPLVDMVANVFFGTCLYNFGQLMINYMGGHRRLWQMVERGRELKLNTLPVCCCCVCLPVSQFSRRTFFRITFMIMQVAVVRPVIMFVAAVLWTDGIYRPGDTSLNNGFIYIMVVNLISTMLAVYGLMLTKGALQENLQEKFSITGKIASLQLTLICSVIPNLIIGILVSNGVITCGPLLTSKGRGEVLYHMILVFLMLPFSMMGRQFYRRASDGDGYAEREKLNGNIDSVEMGYN